jgi:hypothetical protein
MELLPGLSSWLAGTLLETGGPNNIGNVALYTKTRQMSPPLNVAKALAET